MFYKMVRHIVSTGKAHRRLKPFALLVLLVLFGVAALAEWTVRQPVRAWRAAGRFKGRLVRLLTACRERTAVRHSTSGTKPFRPSRRPASRAAAVGLSVCMALTLMPRTAFAAEAQTGLCEHHPSHSAECGYREANPGRPCEHEHTAACCTGGPICGLDENTTGTASGSDAGHTHTRDCYVLDCPHDRGEHTDCGYAEAVEGTPCGYVCRLCGKPNDNGKPGNGIEAITLVAFDGLDETVEYQSVPVGTPLEELILPETLYVTAQTGAEDPEPAALQGVVWEPDSPWDETVQQKSYTFTPVLPEGYALADGAEPPEIYVQLVIRPMLFGSISGDADNDGYYDGDVAAINAIIETNRLTAAKNKPADWATGGIVSWNAKSPKRITALNLTDKSLSNTLDVTGLTNLQTLNCDKNSLSGLNLSGLTSLNTVNCRDNPLTSLKLSDAVRLTIDSSENGTVKLTDYTHSTKSVTLKATPDVGYTFNEWTATGTNLAPKTADPVTFTLNGVIFITPAYAKAGELKTGAVPTVGNDRKTIYANGAPLLLAAGSNNEDNTVVYIDRDRSGTVTNGDTIFDPDGESAAMNDTAEGNNLSKWVIYGGGAETTINGDTKITMTGGNVGNLRGGGRGGAVTGSSSVTISGGTVNYTAAGGGVSCAVGGTASVTVNGGKVKWNVIGGDSAYGSVSNVTVSVTGGAVTEDIVGNNEGSTISGTFNLTIGGGAKVGNNSNFYDEGIVINGGSSPEVTYGVTNFTIAPNLTGADGCIFVVLPDGFDASGNPVIATGAIQADLAKIKLAGGGAAGVEAYFDNGAIKVGAAGAVPSAHTHCVCGGSLTTGGHAHDAGTAWTAWESADRLPDTAGSYYLTKDVALSAAWTVPAGAVNLCLNGRTVTGSATKSAAEFFYSCVEIPGGAALAICDHDGGGSMTFAPDNYTNGSAGIYGGAGSSFTLYGGTVSAAHASSGADMTPFAYGVYTEAGITTLWGGSFEGKVTNTTQYGDGSSEACGARVEGTGVLRLAGAPAFTSSNSANNTNDQAAVSKLDGQIYAQAGNIAYGGSNVTLQIYSSGIVVREVDGSNKDKFKVTNSPAGYSLIEVAEGDKTHLAFTGPYEVQFDANGGTGSMTNQRFESFTDSRTLTRNTFTKEGCIFTGWNTGANGSGTAYADQAVVSALAYGGMVTLYAQWELPAPTAGVTGVSVTPLAADVQKGSTQQFSAAVSGTNSPDQTVTWSLEGSHASGTGISDTGLLTVASDETRQTLTVRATSTVDTGKSGTAAVTVTAQAPPPTVTCTVTFNTNGGSALTPDTAQTDAGGRLLSLPTPAHSGSYSFAGWYTAASGGARVTQETVFTGNTVIYAHWTYTDSSSGGSDGDSPSGGGYVPPSSVEESSGQPNTPITAEIEVTAEVDGNGNVIITVPDNMVKDAIQRAQAAAEKNGTEHNGISFRLIVKTSGKNAGSVTVNLLKVTQEWLIAQKVSEFAVVVDRPDITITLNLYSLQEINRQANADVQITAARLKNTSGLSTEAKAALGSRPVYDLKVTCQSGAKSITSFGSGSVSIELPYTLQNGEAAGGVYAVYVDANGKVSYLANSSYDAKGEVLRLALNHFSVYGIGYKAPAAFTDIAGHWAKTDIEFVVTRGLMSGTDKTTFAPEGAMTRGMLVTALGRLAGVDTNSYKTNKFTDVKTDEPYAPYVNWAAEKGIIKGTAAAMFSPDKTVTRQEMAVIMSNYAKAMGCTVPQTRWAVTFADDAGIGSQAAAAVRQMQMAGVIMSKDGNRFDPAGPATRGVIAAMLHRYVELVINPSTAQGLDVNDSGSAMLYENGKPVKSASRTVNGNTYTFNGCGEAALPVGDKKYLTHIVKKNEYFWSISRLYGCSMQELMTLNGLKMGDIIHPGDTLKIPQA